jgi:hypothetical protein
VAKKFVPTMDEDHHTLWNALVEACHLLDANIHTSENEQAIWDFLHRVKTHETTARMQKEVLRSNSLNAAPAPSCHDTEQVR